MHMISQQRNSVLKKKGMGAKGQFQSMHLAVYPFQIQFLQNVDHKTMLYFQKKFQIIGALDEPILPCKKGTKNRIESSDNIIPFKLFSQNNLVYQWSAYEIHENGEEEFKDCCAIHLNDLVANFIIPQKSQNSRSCESLINLSFGSQELKLKFPRLGAILSINLSVSDDPKNIKKDIEKKYLRNYFEQIPHFKNQINNGNIQLSSKKADSSDELKSSIELLRYQSKKKSDDNRITKQSQQPKQSMIDLDDAILSQERNIQNNHPQQDKQEFEQIKQQIEQIKKKQSEKAEKSKLPPIEQVQQQFATRQLQLQNEISHGILKLSTDKVQQSRIDAKLEIEELQVIEEQIRSSKQTVNYAISPKFKNNQNNTPFKHQAKVSNKNKEQKQQLSLIDEPKLSFKKIIIISIVLFILTIIGGKMIKQLKKRSKRQKK